jgi:hypothetical protein
MPLVPCSRLCVSMLYCVLNFLVYFFLKFCQFASVRLEVGVFQVNPGNAIAVPFDVATDIMPCADVDTQFLAVRAVVELSRFEAGCRESRYQFVVESQKQFNSRIL